jgi:hypothetical protein
MTVFFELMDRSSGNVIRDYDTEDAALEELRDVAQKYGLDEIRGLALLRFEDGRPSLVAMDDELIARLNLASLAAPRS